MKTPQQLAAAIREVATRHLEGTSLFVLDVHVTAGKVARIRVVLDGDRGVTIEDCTLVSRELNEKISGLGVDDYHLEVTTPGVDQPLKLPRQFPKHVGRNLKMVFRDGKVVQGKLLELVADQLRVSVETEKKPRKGAEPEIRDVPLADLEKTFVLISFK